MIIKGKKIGRNESCPCGSGKKFKQCCEKKGISHLPAPESKRIHPLSLFNKDFLLDQISQAFVLSGNHSKNIRLEQLIRESLMYGNAVGGSSDKTKLTNLLNETYAQNRFEDPPEHLFSDNLTFFGGDYVVFPGIFSIGQFVLSNLLMALFFTENNVPSKVKGIIYSRTLLLLNISNEIAHRAGVERYQIGDAADDFILLNNNKTISTFIQYEMIENWCSKYKLDYREIFPFVLREDERFNESDPDKNPITVRPIIQVKSGFKVLSVTNLQAALLHSIFLELIDNKCLDQAIEAYIDFVWYTCVESHLRKMGVSPISLDLPRDKNKMKFGAYKIDTDKIMVVVLNQDNGQNYNRESLFTSSNLTKVDDKIIKTIVEILRTGFPQDEILIVYLSSGIGRPYGVPFDKTGLTSLAMAVCDFHLIMRLRDYDRLSLWNYAQAKKRLLASTILPPIVDELDVYSIYHKKGHSFYLNDDPKSDYLMIWPGTSLSFREEIYRKEDIHSVPFIDDEGIHGALICVKMTGFGDTYHPIDSKILHRVVKGSQRPIWVRFAGEIMEVALENRPVYVKMLEAIGYWIWQFMDSLDPHLDELTQTPITLEFDFRNRSQFEDIKGHNTRNPNVEKEFVIEVVDNRIKVLIPETLNPYLYGNDNIGERHLIKAILKGFSMLQEANAVMKTLTEEEIDRMIDLHAPMGIKKKIFLLDAGDDICLYSTGQEPRYIQEFNTNLILDELVPRLVKLGVITGKPETIADPNSFLKTITGKVLLSWLNEELAIYDSELTLEYLYRQLETLVHTRGIHLFTLPTSIACFSNYEEKVQELMKIEHDLAQANISVRCLMEHIVALPMNKGKEPSQSALDQMLAIMEQIIAWGMVDDQFHFGLTEAQVDILPSARVGTDHSIESEVLLPFRESHAKENIIDSTLAFDRAFEEKNDDADGDNSEFDRIDNAFTIDYGVSLTRILQFSDLLIGLALQQDNSSYCKMTENELRQKTKETLVDISDKELGNLLSYYSLSKRKALFKIPVGFESYDIMPWRFNRGLSLLRKPLIKIENDKDEIYYIWGPRQVYVASYQILSLFYSGKLRCKENGALSVLKGEMLAKKGARFTNKVFTYFNSTLEGCRIDKEVPIKPKSELAAQKDLGDIDVLIIHHELKKIFLVECKNTAIAKTIKEMVEEVENLFGSPSKKGWIKKHEERVDWIKLNIDLLEKKYSMDFTNYEVHGAVLTSEQLPTKYLKKASLPFPMVSFYDVKAHSLSVFVN